MISLDIIEINSTIQQDAYKVTYNDVLRLFSDQLINSMLGVSLLFLIMCVVITRTTIDWPVKPWKAIFSDGIKLDQEFGIRLIVSLGWLCLPVATGFTLMLVSYKLGVTI